MTRDSDVINLIEGYLEEYEGHTPLPATTRDVVRASLSSTFQRPAWWPGWRFPEMSGMARIGLVAVVAGIAALAGYAYLVAPNVGHPDPPPDARSLNANGVIAFVGGTTDERELGGHIYLVSEDGTGLRQLADTAADAFSPAFSFDGLRLAYLSGKFCSACGGPPARLVVVNAIDGAGLVDVDVPGGHATNLAWSPDGRSILAHRDGARGWAASSFDLGTRSWRELTVGLDDRPAWSPDGEWLLVDKGELFAIPANLVGAEPIADPSTMSGARQLTTDATEESGATWSPDGRSVLFVSHSEDGTAVKAVDLRGGAPRILAADGFSPSWSPEGTRVTYLRVDGPRFSRDTVFDPEGAGVWIADADGSNARLVASSFTPARWSPDGTLLYIFGTEGLSTVEADVPNQQVRLLPEEFWPGDDDLSWLSALEQYGGAFGPLGGADWQRDR